MTRRLIEYEFQGLRVFLKEFEALRTALLGNIEAKKEQVAEKLGREIDLDSNKDFTSALKELLHLGAEFVSRPVSQRRLEEFAISYPDVRIIVEYKRLRRRLTRIESIALSAKEGKIYPLFSQVRSPSGLLASKDPNLFENGGDGALKKCIDPSINEFFPDRRTAIGCLQEASGDEKFILDWKWGGDGNRFMAQHPVMKTLDHEELLLAIASGMSGPAMSRKFMLDRITVDSLIYDLRMRYARLFNWLAEFREEALKQGYVTGRKGIKYLEGLTSPSVEKRKNSADAAVRWFISY
jgi:DNA polymerase I-like protein with 3'-5' exonuclease and polymerase domains